MDALQFDRLTRLFGRGMSRRAALRAAVGLASATAAGQTVRDADAARRPTPTPKPLVCPPPKVRNGGQCVCPGGTTTCGPDCCPAGAECCDNGCCYGVCYGEELCCPTGSFVCNGVCLPFFEGACCTDDDCLQGDVCLEGSCVSVCAPDGGSCSANSDCCSGICSAGACYATLAGTCPAEADFCSNQNATFCNNVPSCYCAQDDRGTSICMDGYYCEESCDLCPAGSLCRHDSACCDGGAACLAPCPPDGGGCFIGETLIALADGTSRPVAEVRVGDLVLGDDGAINRVIGIETPLLGERSLFGFDDGRPFVTGSHPFQTDDGWRAILPAETYRDHRLPGVQQLTVSDRLVRLAGVLVPAGVLGGSTLDRIELRTEPYAFAAVTTTVADPATRLYNLQLDGNHTYFANDLLVHNK